MAIRDWSPPEGWHTITTVDLHTAGEPFRVVTGGFPELSGDTILARRRYAKEHLDHLRTTLMWEPRGHADMYGCIVTPPATEEADFGVLFLHNEGYSSMCGHGIIAIATLAVESGMVERREPESRMAIDTPAGLVTAWARVSGGRVSEVRFHNVPSFVLDLDQIVDVPGFGTVRYDLAWGGAFYAYVDAADLGVRCDPDNSAVLVERGRLVKRVIAGHRTVAHPADSDLSSLYGVVFVEPAHGVGAHSRNVCVFADGEVDRSPTGTSVSARLALLRARREIGDESVVFESIIGTRFSGRIVRQTTYEGLPAVIPEVTGSAHITGRHEFLVDPADPLAAGFLLR
jgi:trans-L-3-hydroxyproline dehydratase